MATPKNLSNRVGLGVGMGKGYKNLTPIDSHIHFLSAKGVKMYQPFFRGVKMSHSPLELTLYVPSTQGEKDLMNASIQKARTTEAEGEMSKIFGGTTEVSAVGRWYNDKGLFVREPIAKVTSYTTPKAFNDGKKRFEDYVRQIARRYNQSSIALEYEGDMFFYNNPNKEAEK